MKILVALALISVAAAATIPEPVQLPEAPLPQVQPALPEFYAIDFRPLIIPTEVLDAVLVKTLEVPTSVAQDSPVDAVRIVENPEESIYNIRIVDVAEIQEDAVKSAVESQVDAVRIVDAPVPVADVVVPETFIHPVKIYPDPMLR